MGQLVTQPLLLRREHLQKTITIAKAEHPKETCGIILAKEQISHMVTPVTNISPSPITSFLMSPEELVAIFYKLERENLEILAFYHSHPESPPVPSPTDLEQAYYPETPMIIIGRQNKEWKPKAYYLNKTTYTQIPMKILE